MFSKQRGLWSVGLWLVVFSAIFPMVVAFIFFTKRSNFSSTQVMHYLKWRSITFHPLVFSVDIIAGTVASNAVRSVTFGFS